MNTPKVGDKVFYWPSGRAPEGPQGAMLVEDAAVHMEAVVTKLHNPRLVDLSVLDHADVPHVVMFVPFLHDGDPDPQTLTGRCQAALERQPVQPIVANPGTDKEFVIQPDGTVQE